LKNCVAATNPQYLIEAATYLARVEIVRNERQESYRHIYTLRALQDIQDQQGLDFYDVFSTYMTEQPKWTAWDPRLFTETRFPNPAYYPNSYIPQISFPMRRGQRITVTLGAETTIQLPLTPHQHHDDPIDQQLSGAPGTYSRIEFNNIAPQGTKFTMDCVGEVTLAVESSSLDLKNLTAGLVLDAGRKTIKSALVTSQPKAKGGSAILAARWTDIVPGQRPLFYYTW
jgi:hypothetical protein